MIPALYPLALDADIIQGLVLLILFVGSWIVRAIEERRKGGGRPRVPAPEPESREAPTRPGGGPSRAKPDQDLVWGDRKLELPPRTEPAKAPAAARSSNRPASAKAGRPALQPSLETGFGRSDRRARLVQAESEWAEAGVATETRASRKRREVLARLGVPPGQGRRALHQAVLWREVLGPPKGARSRTRRRW